MKVISRRKGEEEGEPKSNKDNQRREPIETETRNQNRDLPLSSLALPLLSPWESQHPVWRIQNHVPRDPMILHQMHARLHREDRVLVGVDGEFDKGVRGVARVEPVLMRAWVGGRKKRRGGEREGKKEGEKREREKIVRGVDEERRDGTKGRRTAEDSRAKLTLRLRSVSTDQFLGPEQEKVWPSREETKKKEVSERCEGSSDANKTKKNETKRD